MTELPHADILRELLGDFDAQARMLDKRNSEANEVSEQVEKVRKAFSKSEAAGKEALRAALATRARHPALAELVENQATELLHLTSYDAALAVAKIGLNYMPDRTKIHDLHQVAQYLTDAYHAWLGQNRAALQELVEVFQCVVDDADNWLLLFFYGCFNEAVAANDYYRTQFLLEVFPWMNQYPDIMGRMRILIKAIRDELIDQFTHSRVIGLRHLRESLEKNPGDACMTGIARQIVRHYLHEQQFDLANEVAECASEFDPRIADYGILARKLRGAQIQWKAGNIDALRIILDETARLEHEIAESKMADGRGGLARLLT